MDNRMIDVVTEGGAEQLRMALGLIWASAAGGKATHYKVLKLSPKIDYYERDGKCTHHSERLIESPDGRETLILLWHDERSTPLPFPLDLDGAVTFVEGWLKNTNYGNQPDHDGDNDKGWRVFTEDWGHVAGHHYAIVGVQPAWAMYGK